MQFRFQKLKMALAILSVAGLITACQKDNAQQVAGINIAGSKASPSLKAPKGTIFYALTNNNELVKYSSGNPLSEIGSVMITGLQSMEKLLAIDFRPATGQLYSVSNQSRIYVINPNSGLASAISMTAFTPAINGDKVGFDFNPTVDRIRLVTNNDQDLRLNPETGMVVAIDGNISPADPEITSVAYTNSFAGAASTTLYDIDVAGDKLFIQSPPNEGKLVEVGSLGVQAAGESGFDIAPDNSIAIAVLYGRGSEDGQQEASNGNKYRFYYIDLATGKAMNAGKTEREIIGVAIPTNPVAYAVDQFNNLLIFNPSQNSKIITKPITGLNGDMIAGIDLRPANGQLYALSLNSRIYTINMANGAAAVVGSLPFSPALSGTSFGFDFNPTVDRIRVVSNTGQNLRLHPTTGEAIMDVSLNPNPPQPFVDAVAYTNSFAGATTTILYDIDFAADKLFKQMPANAGTLIEVGSLGTDVNSGNGFDIGGISGNSWGIFTINGNTSMYSINLNSGAASMLRSFPVMVKGFSVGLGF